MKTSENLAKIASTGTILVLCFAIGSFALLILQDRTAPAHAYVSLHPMEASSSPTSGPVGATISVSDTGLTTNSGSSVTFGYTATSCSKTGFNAANTSSSNPSVKSDGSFSGWFVWPSTAALAYTVCVLIGSNSSTKYVTASPYQVLSTSAPSVSVDNSSYKVGDNITVTGSNFYPSGTAVTIKLAAPGGNNTSNLGNPVTTDSNGSFTKVYKAPGNPTGTLVIVATGGSGSPPPLQATSSQFAIKKKAAATPTPKPTPNSTPTPISPPPAFAATPTPATAPAETPTAVSAHTPTPAPSPTVAPAPTPVPVVVTHNTNTSFLGGSLPLILAIGLGTLLALGILFVVGRLALRKYLLPVPLPKVPPSGALPWSRLREESLHGNTIMNDVPFAQTMPYNSFYPPGSGGYPPGPGNSPFPPGYSGVAPGPSYGPPQPVPFNGPFGPGNAPQQQIPFNGPFGPGNSGVAPGPGNSGVAPANVAQEPFPPNDWFAPPNQ